MRRHWSFLVTDKRLLYPLAAAILAAGLIAAFVTEDASHVTRAGNFIIGTGVWMSMRYTFREGLNTHKDLADRSPVVPGTTALNGAHFNNIAFAIGDARLQVHGFVLVVLGSTVGSFGDIIVRCLFPARFV